MGPLKVLLLFLLALNSIMLAVFLVGHGAQWDQYFQLAATAAFGFIIHPAE